MAKTTSFVLGAELDAFVREQVESGKYATASDVVRAALERLADERRKEEQLSAALDHALANGVRHSSAEAWRRVDAGVEAALTSARRRVAR